jgi:hypothetical protein
MKSEGQIKHKLSQVRFRHLKRELRTGLSRKSLNCQFNGTVDLPGRACLGVCLYKAEDPSVWNGGACDESISDRASRCPLFECLNTKDLIRDEFDSFLEKADRAQIAARYPDMAALLWALDLEKAEDIPGLEEEDDEQYGVPPPEPEVPHSFGLVGGRVVVVNVPASLLSKESPLPNTPLSEHERALYEHEMALSPESRALLQEGIADVRKGQVRVMSPDELEGDLARVEPWVAIPTPVPPVMTSIGTYTASIKDTPKRSLWSKLIQIWSYLVRVFRHE